MKSFLFPFCFFTVLGAQAQVHSVAIIGGGTAGLATAHAIHAADSLAIITLFEKAPQVGGNAYRVVADNKGQEVFVDLGPQYFTEGAWDAYIALLDHYGLYGEDRFARFPASFTLASRKDGRSIFCTPKDGKMREKFGRLLAFNRFYSSARKLYLHPEKQGELSVGEWLDQLSLKEEFKQVVILPFLSASLGVDHTAIRKVSAHEIVKLFAFRGALKKNTFNVFYEGMGGMMAKLAEKLQAEGIEIRTGNEVVYVDDIEQGLYVVTADGTESLFDFVVFATHPDALYEMVKESEVFAPALPVLQQLSYFRADIVLHRDSSLVARENPSFLNILVDEENHVYSSTMNLGAIDPRYEGLYKSWLPAEKIAEVKAAGLFLAERSFFHPMITTEFIENTQKLQAIEQQLHARGFAIAGGWTQGMETQETAVISGQKAAAVYLNHLQSHSPEN